METKYYPIDFDAVQKGDEYTPEQLKEITGCEPETKEYSFAVMSLCSQIMRECAARGSVVTVAMRRGNLCVLNDADAAEYNAKKVDTKFKQANMCHMRRLHVDVSKLDESQAKAHERSVLVQGAMLQAAAAARKVAALPHKRATPGLAIE